MYVYTHLYARSTESIIIKEKNLYNLYMLLLLLLLQLLYNYYFFIRRDQESVVAM